MRGEWIRKPSGSATVIFVHGILSSGETCWQNENGTFWPEILRDEPKLAAIGIYVFTYQTGLFSGSYRLSDIVDALREHTQLDDVLDSERLVFVCHSMGGIVVRKFIVEQAVDLLSSSKEVELFLIASPSLGSTYADWLSPIAKLFGHSQADVLRFVRNNDWLLDLDKEFTNLKESGKLKIRGKELVEDKFIIMKNIFRRQLVEPFSGAKNFGHPFKIPGSDHFSIAKPADETATQHRILCRWILQNGSGLAERGESNSSRKRLSATQRPNATKRREAASHETIIAGRSVLVNKALGPNLAHTLVAAIEPARIKPLDDALMICVLRNIPGNFDDAGHVLKMLKSTLERSSLVTRKKARELVQRARRLNDEFRFDESGVDKWERGYEQVRVIVEPILAELPSSYQCYEEIVRAGPDTHVPFLVDRYFSNPRKTEDNDHNGFTQRRLIREHIVNIIATFSLGKECLLVLDMEARQFEDEIPFELESNLELIDVIKGALGVDFAEWYKNFRGVSYEVELQAVHERQQRQLDRKSEELEEARKDFLAYRSRYREPPTARQAALLIQKIDKISEGLDETKKLRYFGESNRLIDRAKQLLKPYFPDVAFRMHEAQENDPGPYAREKVLDGLKAVRELLEIEAAKGEA